MGDEPVRKGQLANGRQRDRKNPDLLGGYVAPGWVGCFSDSLEHRPLTAGKSICLHNVLPAEADLY